MKSFEIITFLICITALFAYFNTRYIKMQQMIGIMMLSLVSSLLIAAANLFLPGPCGLFIQQIAAINFHSLLMNGMLGLLLFAGSMHIDAVNLRKEGLPVIVFSTVSTIISTFLIGIIMYFIFYLFHAGIDLIYCLLFASLISPTDPVAVLAILKKAGLPKSLETKIAGESLFNDGVAVVIFLTLMEVAQTGPGKLPAADISLLFLKEAGGGLLFGTALGYIGVYVLQTIDKYEVEVMMMMAIVMGGYTLANHLHLSGPLAMVVAGIIIGNKTGTPLRSEKTAEYVDKFWDLIDDLLNAVLFMLIGLEMLVINTDWKMIVISTLAIVITLFSRWISLAVPFYFMRKKVKFVRGALTMLTWGGLRGGLSVALALSIPKDMHADEFVAITYIIVVFSIIVQGLTISKLYKWISPRHE